MCTVSPCLADCKPPPSRSVHLARCSSCLLRIKSLEGTPTTTYVWRVQVGTARCEVWLLHLNGDAGYGDLPSITTNNPSYFESMHATLTEVRVESVCCCCLCC